MKKIHLSAVGFQYILLLLIIVALGATIIGGNYLKRTLTNTIQQSAHAKIDAEVSSNTIHVLDSLQQALERPENKRAAEKAKTIIGSTTDYRYQDQFIKDITAIASQTGVGITGFTFPNPGESAASGATTTNGAAAPAAMPPGVTSLLVTINTESPIPYDNYLRFLRALETNVTRLQVTGITLSPDAENSNSVSNASIGIQVFVRE